MFFCKDAAVVVVVVVGNILVKDGKARSMSTSRINFCTAVRNGLGRVGNIVQKTLEVLDGELRLEVATGLGDVLQLELIRRRRDALQIELFYWHAIRGSDRLQRLFEIDD